MEAARRKGVTARELHDLETDWFHKQIELQQWLDSIYTKRLVAKANRLRLPIPQKPARRDAEANEYWVFGMENADWYLTPAGYKKLRAEIRAEQKARHEIWLPWLTLIASSIAAITGMIVVLSK